MPLNKIGQYTCVGFRIRGAINYKSDLDPKFIRGKETSFFYAVIIDANGTEMKINFWGDRAIESFGKLKKGVRVWMTGLAPYKPKAQWATHGPVELKSTNGLQIQVDDEEQDDEDDDVTILHSWNAPPSILKIKNKLPHTVLDAIGFVYDVSDVKKITTKRTQKQADLLTFELVDQTARIRVSAWGKQAHTQLREGQLIGIKGARISEYNGRSLTVTGYIETEPQGTICDELKHWKQTKNPTVKALYKQVANLSDQASILAKDWSVAPILTIQQAKQVKERYRIRQKLPEIQALKVTARIEDVDNSLWYSKSDGLHWKVKLVIEDDEDNWIEACGFDKVGMKFFKISADEAAKLQTDDEQKFVELIESIKYKNSNQIHLFCIYAKENKWNAELKYLDWIIDDVDQL